MIASIEGTVSEKLSDYVIINVGGVGYGVFVSLEDYPKLEVGSDAKLLIYEHVREQAHDLFGFLERGSQDLFEQLLNVNGVGPKMALNILSIGGLEPLKQAISGGDVAYLMQATGVGKKVAERIVVELREKVGEGVSDFTASDLISRDSSLSKDEAALGLVALGYTAQDAHKALKDIDPKLPSEERIKQALKKM